MSAMQNLDRIFQLIGRLIRLHPDGRRKFFFKVVPEGLEEEYKRIMSATLCLSDEEYFTKYDGENFLGVRIPGTRPEPQPRRIDDIDDVEPRDDDGDDQTPPPFVPNTEWLGLPDGLNFFKDLLFKTRNKTVENYAFASIMDIKIQLGEYKIMPQGYWTEERCLEEAKKYKTVTEWVKNSGSSYSIASRDGFLDQCTAHMQSVQKPTGYWTKERCVEEALKFNTVSEWKKNSSSSYTRASKNNWVDECTKHMKKVTPPWTKESCIKEAKKYNTKSEWQKKSAGSYSAANKNGWYDECVSHMQSVHKPAGYWTLERCIEETKKYRTLKELHKYASSVYDAAAKNGWRDELKKYFKK
jgi:hypothetical protein